MNIHRSENKEEVEIKIYGEPKTYSTNGEKEWKEKIRNVIGNYRIYKEGTYHGICMRFFLSPEKIKKIDVDNLCEPVFSSVVNWCNWFYGRRSNIGWWHAEKVLVYDRRESGLLLKISGKYVLPRIENIYGSPIFDMIFAYEDIGKIQSLFNKRVQMKTSDRFAVRLMFGDEKVNIGEIATGLIKKIIDKFFPRDHNIYTLQVQKGIKKPKQSYIRISIWKISDA